MKFSDCTPDQALKLRTTFRGALGGSGVLQDYELKSLDGFLRLSEEELQKYNRPITSQNIVDEAARLINTSDCTL
jgi:hypothetical protein